MNKENTGVPAPISCTSTSMSATNVNKSFGDRPLEYFEGNHFVPKWLADQVMTDYSFVTIEDADEIFVYIEGTYTNNGQAIVESVSQARLGSKSNNRHVNEVVGHIRRSTRCARSEFDNDFDIINVENGLFNTATMEMQHHTPTYLSLRKNPITYNPYSSCPQIDKFIKEVVRSEHIETIYEIVGYALSPRKNMKRAFIFEGERNSGKSKMLELIERMVGGLTTTHVSPIDVSNTVYGAAEYFGKQLNIVDDLGNTPIENTGILKSIISGGRINAQFKYGQPFDYTPNVLCIFATNEVPPTTNSDDAYASRFSIIPFSNAFEGDNDDKDLISKMTTVDELSGFFTKCMNALAMLRERGEFTGDGTLADRITQYKYSSNPFTRFVEDDCVIDDPDDYIQKDELHQAYFLWSRDHNTRTRKPREVTEFLKSIGCIVRRITTDDGERIYAYCGIKLKEVT